MEHPRTVLRRYGLTAKKSLGQNFIFDDRILARIADAADIGPDDQILEIGPGLGALTVELASQANRVVAVEIDDRLLAVLAKELMGQEQVLLVHGDILEFDSAQYFDNGYKAVGNVPYYITGAILRRLLSARARPDLTVLTVQNEVAQRLIAQPGSMSMLSVMVQFYTEAELLFPIKAGSFWPKPDVDSAVVRLIRRRPPIVGLDEEEAFLQLVKIGFSQRRKQLQKNMRVLGLPRDRLTAAFETAAIDGRRRAQSLSLAEWHDLYLALR